MSKTTIFLLFLLFIALGILLYIVYGAKNKSFITSIAAPIRSVVNPINTKLYFSTNEQIIQPGQTVTVAVLVHSTNPHPSIVQLEISYDPNMLIVDSVMPGTFFTNPDVALQNIDPITGRISYALHCPSSNTSNTTNDCVNGDSSTVAVLTFTANRYAFKNTTMLSFLPKTLVRTSNGRDVLQSTSGLTLTIGKSLYPVASSSAIVIPGANYIHVTPVH
jgi:hypothetical protein